MQKIPRPLLVRHDNKSLRRRLEEVATSQKLDLRFLADWEAVRQSVLGAPASALLLVDPIDGGSIAADLVQLIERFPSLTVVAALPVEGVSTAAVIDLGKAGVVQIIDLEEDTTAYAIGRRLNSARGKPLRALVEASLPEQTSASARAILSAAAIIVAEGGQGEDLAEVLRITPRTLSRWCRKAGLPPPKRLLAWMRILQAAEFLDDPGRPVSAVAAACGYAADSSLRLALRRFTGMTPTEMREKGAFDSASVGFLEALQEAKAPKKRYRAPSKKKK